MDSRVVKGESNMKAIFAVLSIFAASSAWAGYFDWRFINLSNGIPDQVIRESIIRGISNSESKPSLPKPWVLKITVAGGTVSQNPEPFVVLVEREKANKEGGIIKCRRIHFGTGTYDIIKDKIAIAVTEATAYVTSPTTCP